MADKIMKELFAEKNVEHLGDRDYFPEEEDEEKEGEKENESTLYII